MIQIDIDIKIEEILVTPTESGMNAIFVLTDAVNPKTRFHLKFYKKQVDYIMNQFYDVDRAKMKEELRLEFLAREDKLRGEIMKELQENYARTKKAMTPRGMPDA